LIRSERGRATTRSNQIVFCSASELCFAFPTLTLSKWRAPASSPGEKLDFFFTRKNRRKCGGAAACARDDDERNAAAPAEIRAFICSIIDSRSIKAPMAKPALPWHLAVPCAAIAGGACCWLGYKAICNKMVEPASHAADLPCAAANVIAAFDRTLKDELPSHASQGALCALTDRLSILRLLAKGKLGLKPQRALDDQV